MTSELPSSNEHTKGVDLFDPFVIPAILAARRIPVKQPTPKKAGIAMTKKSPFTGRALLALLGACLFQCAFIGILVNSNGVFMTAIRGIVG